MRFEFDTATDTAKEATALATALTVLYGPAIADILDKAGQALETSLASDGHPFNVADHAARATAETAPPPPVSSPTATVDTAGLPWDERIHASTKTTNKDGTWSRRRNTPDATFDAVMAELKAKPQEASAADAFADPTSSAAPAETDTAGSSTEDASAGQTAETAASPSSTVVPPPPPATGVVTFPQLMVKITKAQTAGTIDKTTIDGFLATFGLDKIAGLASAGADTVQAVNAMVDAHVAG